MADYLGRKVDSENAPLVQFLIDQGCIPFVKTNLPQGMLTMDSRNAIYGITRNPNDLSRSPGGSSSGEAVILAQGASVIGIGSDIAGSLRIPAAWCGGCVTLRPTAQRFIRENGGPDTDGPSLLCNEMETYGFMTRDVSSLVALHRLFFSEAIFFKFRRVTPIPFREEIFSSSKPLRIGYFTNIPNTTETVPACRRAVLEAKAALEARGHELVEFEPPRAADGYLLAIKLMFGDGDDEFMDALERDVEIAYPNGHLIVATFPMWLKRLGAIFLGSYFGKYQVDCVYAMQEADSVGAVTELYGELRAYQDYFVECFKAAQLDALLCPPVPCPAVPVDTTREMINAVYTALFNVLNWPAGVIQMSTVTQQDEEEMCDYPINGSVERAIKSGCVQSETVTSTVGLPVAVQIAGPWFGDETVLRLMRELEETFHSSSFA